jgi:hypothetical protein
MPVKDESYKEKAIVLFTAGKSVAAVSKELGITWAKAATVKKHMNGAAGSGDEPEAETGEGEDPQDWEISMTDPMDKLDDLLNRAEAQEIAQAVRKCDGQTQANVFQALMQRRLDQLLC